MALGPQALRIKREAFYGKAEPLKLKLNLKQPLYRFRRHTSFLSRAFHSIEGNRRPFSPSSDCCEAHPLLLEAIHCVWSWFGALSWLKRRFHRNYMSFRCLLLTCGEIVRLFRAHKSICGEIRVISRKFQPFKAFSKMLSYLVGLLSICRGYNCKILPINRHFQLQL